MAKFMLPLLSNTIIVLPCVKQTQEDVNTLTQQISRLSLFQHSTQDSIKLKPFLVFKYRPGNVIGGPIIVTNQNDLWYVQLDKSNAHRTLGMTPQVLDSQIDYFTGKYQQIVANFPNIAEENMFSSLWKLNPHHTGFYMTSPLIALFNTSSPVPPLMPAYNILLKLVEINMVVESLFTQAMVTSLQNTEDNTVDKYLTKINRIHQSAQRELTQWFNNELESLKKKYPLLDASLWSQTENKMDRRPIMEITKVYNSDQIQIICQEYDQLTQIYTLRTIHILEARIWNIMIWPQQWPNEMAVLKRHEMIWFSAGKPLGLNKNDDNYWNTIPVVWQHFFTHPCMDIPLDLWDHYMAQIFTNYQTILPLMQDRFIGSLLYNWEARIQQLGIHLHVFNNIFKFHNTTMSQHNHVMIMNSLAGTSLCKELSTTNPLGQLVILPIIDMKREFYKIILASLQVFIHPIMK